jgi:hypothetical protein
MEPERILVRRHWFPGQRVEVDGRPAEPERDPLDGEIVVPVSAGSHDLRVYPGFRALDLLYCIVSGGALLACLCGTIAPRRRVLAWMICMVAAVVTGSVGLFSVEGFSPPTRLRSAMEADAVGPSCPPAGGWYVVHYEVRSEAIDFERGRRGYAAELNLGPGGALRKGMAVWTARVRLPQGMELAMEHAGGIVLAVDGKRLLPPGRSDGSASDEAFGLLAISTEQLESHEDYGPRVVVAASGIEEGARARLVARPRGSDERWQLIPPEWLQPDDTNVGYLELFGLRAPEGAE